LGQTDRWTDDASSEPQTAVCSNSNERSDISCNELTRSITGCRHSNEVLTYVVTLPVVLRCHATIAGYSIVYLHCSPRSG